jgi:hypothetical protein
MLPVYATSPTTPVPPPAQTSTLGQSFLNEVEAAKKEAFANLEKERQAGLKKLREEKATLLLELEAEKFSLMLRFNRLRNILKKGKKIKAYVIDYKKNIPTRVKQLNSILAVELKKLDVARKKQIQTFTTEKNKLFEATMLEKRKALEVIFKKATDDVNAAIEKSKIAIDQEFKTKIDSITTKITAIDDVLRDLDTKLADLNVKLEQAKDYTDINQAIEILKALESQTTKKGAVTDKIVVSIQELITKHTKDIEQAKLDKPILIDEISTAIETVKADIAANETAKNALLEELKTINANYTKMLEDNLKLKDDILTALENKRKELEDSIKPKITTIICKKMVKAS